MAINLHTLLLFPHISTDFLLIIALSLLTAATTTTTATSNSIHDLLRSRGLPAGLFPATVRSYDLDHSTGLLRVNLDRPCMASFETKTRVYFESVVRANLSYGGLIGVEGLSQEELFLWLPVKDIIVNDLSSGVILFDIGVAYKQLAFSLFEDPPICNPLEGVLEKDGRKEVGLFEAQR